MEKGKKMKDSIFKHFNPMALREKYDSSYKGYKGNSPFSSFWSDNDWTSRRTEFIDEVDDNGDPLHWRIEYEAIVPILIKAIQELSAKVTALEDA